MFRSHAHGLCKPGDSSEPILDGQASGKSALAPVSILLGREGFFWILLCSFRRSSDVGGLGVPKRVAGPTLFDGYFYFTHASLYHWSMLFDILS